MRKNQSSIQTQAVKQVFSLRLVIIFILISLGLFKDTSAQDSLQVKGFGIDRNSAIIDALKLGIQQRYGVIINADSKVHNFVLQEDKILSFSKGYAAQFSILSERPIIGKYFVDLIVNFDNRSDATDKFYTKGYGNDRNSAINDGLRLAVQQRYGVQVQSETETLNYSVGQDQIVTFSDGKAAAFTITNEGPLYGNYEVKLRIKFEHISDFSALLRSTIMPGWGQYYKGRTTKAWIFALSEVVMLSTSLYTDYKADEMYDKSLNTSSQYNRDWYYDKHLEYQKVRNISIAVTSAGWIYNMVNAFISVPILGQRIETKTTSTNHKERHAFQIGLGNTEQNTPAIQLFYSF